MTFRPDSSLTPQQQHALGVLVPVRPHPVRVLPGRHPLGQAGDGMRLLRTRPFVPGEDNPRDIDKFSPAHALQVAEWEAERQATVMLLADNSASMDTRGKRALRNACLVQLTYSLWRAGDRVTTTLFGTALGPALRTANLKGQMTLLARELTASPARGNMDASLALQQYALEHRHTGNDLLFVVSDFVATDNNALQPGPDWNSLLRRTGRDVVAVIVSCPLPESPGGLLRLRDAERGERMLGFLGGARLRRSNRAERERVRGLRRRFQAAGVDVMLVDQQQDIYAQLARLARTRRQRKR